MIRMARRGLLSTTTIGLALGFLAASAAAAPDTYVSALGRDGGSCTRLRPCRTFAAALAATDPAGTVLALDSGTFSTSSLLINQSVTIAAEPGVRAVLRPASDSAVYVDGGASDVVVLRGLSFIAPPGTATPSSGIIYNSAEALYVEHCTIDGFPTKGLLVLDRNRLVVRDTVVRGARVGISLDGPVHAALDNVTIADSEFGVLSGLGAQASIRNSLITGNGTGLLVDAGFETVTAELSIENCLITHNQTGVEVRTANSTGRLSNSTVTNNGVGAHASGGVLETRGNNTIRGNGTNVSGTLTPVSGE